MIDILFDIRASEQTHLCSRSELSQLLELDVARKSTEYPENYADPSLTVEPDDELDVHGVAY